MKILFTFLLTFFVSNSYSQIEVSRGDTLEITKELRKEYFFKQTIDGRVFKGTDGKKYLIVWGVSEKSKNYILKTPPHSLNIDTLQVTFADSIKPQVEYNKNSQSILSTNQQQNIIQAGIYLEKSSAQKNGAIAISLITASIGAGIILLSDNSTHKNTITTGYVIIGVGQLTSLILNVVGNSNIGKAGNLLRKEKLKL